MLYLSNLSNQYEEHENGPFFKKRIQKLTLWSSGRIRPHDCKPQDATATLQTGSSTAIWVQPRHALRGRIEGKTAD